MLKVKVNKAPEKTIEFSTPGFEKGKVDGTEFEWNVITVKEGSFHILYNNRSYNAELIKADPIQKLFVIGINGNKYNVSVKDKYDELLQQMGFDKFSGNKVNDMKAPMPGLVLDIMTNEGSSVKKGDSLVLLEAMKMENILKAPSDGMVKKINIKKGIAVEKNQVLISFE